jgi:hypothetical protein
MHSAIFVVNVKQRVVQDWQSFLYDVLPKLKGDPGAIRLGQNVWLLNVQRSARALAWLVATAERLGLPYAIMPLEHEPRWVLGGFDPNIQQAS